MRGHHTFSFAIQSAERFQGWISMIALSKMAKVVAVAVFAPLRRDLGIVLRAQRTRTGMGARCRDFHGGMEALQ